MFGVASCLEGEILGVGHAGDGGRLHPTSLALRSAVTGVVLSVGRKVFAAPLARGEQLLRCAQQVMNDFRLFADKSHLDYSSTSFTNSAQAAQDMVDLILFASTIYFATIIGANDLEQRRRVYWWELRNAFVAELARVHAETPELAINDDAVIKRVRQNLGTDDETRSHRSRSLRARVCAAWAELRDRAS